MVFNVSSSIQRCSMALGMDFDKRMRGRRKDRLRNNQPVRREDERAAQGQATQQLAGATRGQEGDTGRNERTRRGDATRVAQREDGERQCDNQLA